uniref:Endonuclease/exonuclease/phosphatase domain-containing protein n=1 Tax=Aegilops tauschii subsp. strangulata TaxID=200361 RepID=A0A453CMW0_AEGTS
MRALLWNIRGFGHAGRRTQLKDYIRKEAIDIVGLQETIRSEFRHHDILAIDPLERFVWHHKPATGHSGGMLLGFCSDTFEVLTWEVGIFFIAANIRVRASLRELVIVQVYGPADHSRSAEFLVELEAKVREVSVAQLPLMVGGDFNLIRSGADKNNDNINWPRVAMFNNAVASMALREVARTGARYTWTNKQLAPVRSVLDRVFMSPDWEVVFPLCSLLAETRIGSDHVPLILSSGEDRIRRSPRFFFETAWFEVPDFDSIFRERWLRSVQLAGQQRGPMEFWIAVGGRLRASLKGWGANQGRADKILRERLLAEITVLDNQADTRPFSEQEWAHRYALEGQVEALLRSEEEYWRRRGGLKWTLKGDANTQYFHAYANGRRRKCSILRLQSEQGLLLQHSEITQHIYDFYISLMGTDEAQQARLSTDVWLPYQKVLHSENEELGLAFLPKEIDDALLSMRTDMAPGPDGWPVAMFKHFWPLLRDPIYEVCNGFMRGFVDIARLNYGVLSLIPKVPGADNIRQYRPIALINVPFKICAKSCATRLSPIAHRTISRAQSAFIRGRNILEGPLALQETLHELKRTHEPARSSLN